MLCAAWLLGNGRSGGGVLLAFAPVFLLVAVLATVFSRTSPRRRITVDFDRQEVVFENLRISRGFLPSPPEARSTCAFQDLRGAERCRGRHNEWLIIHTKNGRVPINEHWDRCDELRRILLTIAPASGIPLLRGHSIPTLVGALVLLAALVLAFVVGWLP